MTTVESLWIGIDMKDSLETDMEMPVNSTGSLFEDPDSILYTKICRRCGQRKNKQNWFWKDKNNRDRYSNLCKACYRIAKNKVRNLHKMAGPPPSTCECCGKKPSIKPLCLDHDHTTNEVRGWLCDQCNTAIGHLGDTIPDVEKALTYLKRAKEKASLEKKMQ